MTTPASTVPTPSLPSATSATPLAYADLATLRARLSSLTAELITALDVSSRSRVEKIPLVYDADTAEVNAFASCVQGKSLVAVTDGLLLLVSHLAEAQATDESFGTNKFNQYVSLLVATQRKGAPVPPPPATFYTAEQRAFPQKIAREWHLVDEALAFVVAHELGHHYLGHLPCSSTLPLDMSELGIALSSAVPAFNQPAEAAADVAATRNVLLAGRARTGTAYSEGGGLMTIRFFAALDQASPVDMFDFERTHPPPSLRDPIIRSAAQAFRATGGFTLPLGL